MENPIQIKIPKRHIENFNYSKYVQPVNQNVFMLIDKALSDLKANWQNERILDIGCNIGNLIITSEGRISPVNYTGIDIQEYPLTIARAHFPEYNFILCGDSNRIFNKNATENPTVSEYLAEQDKFDVIVCHGVFPHFDLVEITEMFKIAKNSLVDDGVFVFSFWSHEKLQQFCDYLQRDLKINISRDIINHELTNHLYLINRNQVAYTPEEIAEIDDIKWFETFHEPDALREFVGNFSIIDVGKSFHHIARITRNDIL